MRAKQAGFLCLIMSQDCKRAAHTTYMLVLTSEALYGHVVSGFTTNEMQVCIEFIMQSMQRLCILYVIFMIFTSMHFYVLLM
jgi:hypothetical protein